MSKLARLVGVSRPCVLYWESGRSRPRPRNAERLEAVLGLEPGSLNGNDDGPEDRRRVNTSAATMRDGTDAYFE
jgi:transcriptional regulator with XRE-family HTH domain